MKKTKIHLYILVCITLLNMPVLAQQTGKHTIGFSQRPISYFNYETGLTETIPTHQISNFNPDDETTWDEDDHELLSEKYGGQSPQFALQTICDKQGEPIVFIVDDFIYNKNGEGFYNPNQADYFNLHGDESLFNPYVINPDYDQRVLYENIIVIPEPNSCNSFYVFYGLLDQPSSLSSIPQVYYRKLTYLDEENIELTEPEILSLDYLPACQQFSNFTMAMTEYDEIQNNNLLIIQYVGDVFVIEIDDNIGNWDSKKLEPAVNKSLLEPQSGSGFVRINPVLTSKTNGDVVFALPMWVISNPTHFELWYYSFSRNFDAINPINFEFVPIDYSGNDKIRGMEISPNGYQLYTTQENQTGFQVFDIQNYIQGLGNPPTNFNTIGSGNFSNSDLFLGRDNKIYCIENLTSSTGLTTINDPNNPASTTLSSNVFSLSNFQKSLIGNYYDRDAYIFPYQIDQSDYTTNYPPAQYTQPDWATIGANETWTPGIGNNPFNSETGIITLADDFEIPSGKYIQIENMEFHFANDKKAIINTGSVLRIINSKLTSADHCDQTTMWGGVLVKGNANADQSAANQGRFRMDTGSEISNAVYAVKVESGAICQIYGGEIKNNVYGVYFNPYIHPQIPAYNASIIQNATFETNRALNSGGPNMHIRLNGVNDIDINLCTLTNTRDNTVRADFRGQGLYTYNADFTMSNCDISGFYYGAKVYGGSTPSITDCDFSNNLRSVLMKSVLLADVRNNTFNGVYSFPIRKDELIPNPYPYEYYNYSLYVAGDGISSAIHEIKGNAITNGRLGLLLYNTGESATQIRDNTFNNISGASNVSAAIVMGKNSNYSSVDPNLEGDEGTEFRCNSFSQNTYAMSIVDGNMRKYQGEHNASSGEEYAGNEFDHYGTSTERDFYVDQNIANYLDIPQYEYYSHANNSHKILHYTSTKINNLGQTDDYINDDCSEDSGGGGIVIKGKSVGESIGDIETLDSEITLKSFELSERTDDGETYIMLSEVENANTTNSTEVATELSELNGYISDEVTLTYMQNSATSEFDKAGALLANSPLPSTAKNEIDNMEMNSTLKTIIKAGQNGKNSREIKEAEIAGLKQTRGLIVKEMVNRVMTNDSLQSERNELISFLQNDNTFTAKIHLLNLYKAKKNNAAIETCINNLRTQIHSFDVDRLTEMENYLDLQELVLNVDNGLFSMEDAVSQNMEFLQNLANTENVAGEIQAQILLEETGNSEFLETIKLPEEIMDNKNMAIQSESENMTNDFESIVKVYPNPSSDYFSIEYALIDFKGNEQIEIYSSNGRLIDRLDIPYAIGTYKYERKLPAGNYIIKVGKNYTQKLNIL